MKYLKYNAVDNVVNIKRQQKIPAFFQYELLGMLCGAVSVKISGTEHKKRKVQTAVAEYTANFKTDSAAIAMPANDHDDCDCIQ
jgi:hypothetical protein